MRAHITRKSEITRTFVESINDFFYFEFTKYKSLLNIWGQHGNFFADLAQ